MTPLAYELLKDLTTPGAFKSLDPHARETLWSIVNEAKFFDVVSAQEMILDVAIKTYEAFRKYSALDRRLDGHLDRILRVFRPCGLRPRLTGP